MTALLSAPLIWSQLTWPREVDEVDLHAGLRQIAGSREVPLVLRAEGAHGEVRHLIGGRTKRPDQLLVQHLSGVRTEPAEPQEVGQQAVVLGLRFSTRRRAIRSDTTESGAASLVAALAGTQRDERLILEWALLASLVGVAVPNRLDGVGPDSWGRALLVAPLWAPGRADPEVRRALALKRAEAGWRTVGRLAVVAGSTKRQRSLLTGVLSALRALESPGLQLVVRRIRPSSLGTAGVLTGRPAALSLTEVPALAGWPIGDLRRLPVRRQSSRLLPAHPAMPHYKERANQRLVGVGQRGNADRALVLSVQDALRHLHVIGPTGAGKSTLLLGLIYADMTAGHSLVVFDPKGDLVTDVLARVPDERRGDVVVLDPSDHAPVGLNPLASGGDPELVADGLLGTLHELFASAWGPRTQDILHACLLTLAGRDDASLALIPLLLTNLGYRARVIRGLDDPLGVGGFWAQFERQSEAERLAAIGPVSNKLRQILNRSAFRAVVGQLQPRFDLAEVFHQPRIVVVNLAKGLLGPEGSALFGALVWARLWQAAQTQVQVAAERRRPVLVYADEFQEYLRLPVSFTDMLVQARGLGVGLTLAHQHLGQLGTEVRDTVLANAGSRVSFQLLAGDAAVLTKASPDLDAEDLTSLGNYEVYASLRAGGTATGWMSGRTRLPPPASADPLQLRRDSAERYGVPRQETEAALRALLDEPTGAERAPVGAKRRPRSEK